LRNRQRASRGRRHCGCLKRGTLARRRGDSHGQLRCGTILNGMKPQGILMRGRRKVAMIRGRRTAGRRRASLSATKGRANRRHNQRQHSQKTAGRSHPALLAHHLRVSHSHLYYATPLLSRRQPSGYEERSERATLQSPYPCESLSTTTFPANER
jgi:hypothetical protein